MWISSILLGFVVFYEKMKSKIKFLFLSCWNVRQCQQDCQWNFDRMVFIKEQKLNNRWTKVKKSKTITTHFCFYRYSMLHANATTYFGIWNLQLNFLCPVKMWKMAHVNQMKTKTPQQQAIALFVLWRKNAIVFPKTRLALQYFGCARPNFGDYCFSTTALLSVHRLDALLSHFGKEFLGIIPIWQHFV